MQFSDKRSTLIPVPSERVFGAPGEPLLRYRNITAEQALALGLFLPDKVSWSGGLHFVALANSNFDLHVDFGVIARLDAKFQRFMLAVNRRPYGGWPEFREPRKPRRSKRR